MDFTVVVQSHFVVLLFCDAINRQDDEFSCVLFIICGGKSILPYLDSIG
jgi:hypothetical protein